MQSNIILHAFHMVVNYWAAKTSREFWSYYKTHISKHHKQIWKTQTVCKKDNTQKSWAKNLWPWIEGLHDNVLLNCFAQLLEIDSPRVFWCLLFRLHCIYVQYMGQLSYEGSCLSPPHSPLQTVSHCLPSCVRGPRALHIQEKRATVQS